MGQVNPFVDLNADDPSLEQAVQTPMKVSLVLLQNALNTLWIDSLFIFYNFFASSIFRIVQKMQLKHVMEQENALKTSWQGNLIM